VRAWDGGLGEVRLLLGGRLVEGCRCRFLQTPLEIGAHGRLPGGLSGFMPRGLVMSLRVIDRGTSTAIGAGVSDAGVTDGGLDPGAEMGVRLGEGVGIGVGGGCGTGEVRRKGSSYPHRNANLP